MTDENENENPNPVEEVKDKVDEVTEEHPSIDPPKEEHHETPDVTAEIRHMGDKIISAIESLKESSPVTEPEEEVLDETPLRKPWTHRWFGK